MKLLLLLSLLVFCSCKDRNDYLLLKQDKNNQPYYINQRRQIKIPTGIYSMCFTDTFRKMAIVEKAGKGIVAIDRNENVMFDVFIFDNGPDYISDGYFRIITNGKIGYADADGNIRIKPQYGCAYPFEKGKAKVSIDCKTIADGEHSIWESKNWFYIDTLGGRLK